MRTHIKGEEHARTHAKRRGREVSVRIVIGPAARGLNGVKIIVICETHFRFVPILIS